MEDLEKKFLNIKELNLKNKKTNIGKLVKKKLSKLHKKLIKQEIQKKVKFIIFVFSLVRRANKIIDIIEGKNLKTDDEGIKIELVKSAYPMLPKIIKQENIVKIEKGKLITFDNFLTNIIKKIDIKKMINITIATLELIFVSLVSLNIAKILRKPY